MAIEDLTEMSRRLIAELESLAEKNRQMPASEETAAIRNAIKKRIQDLKDKLEDAQQEFESDE